MKEASLKLKMYASNVSIVDNDNLQSRMLSFVLWSFGLLALTYILILGNTVFNIVERRTVEANARAIATEMGELEIEYLRLSSQIDVTLGTSLGFKEVKDKQFATRKSLGALNSVKLANNEL